jgi:hypothetical protein
MDAEARGLAAAAVRHGLVHARRSHGRGVVSLSEEDHGEAREADAAPKPRGRSRARICGLVVDADVELQLSRGQSRAQERRRGLRLPTPPQPWAPGTFWIPAAGSIDTAAVQRSRPSSGCRSRRWRRPTGRCRS